MFYDAHFTIDVTNWSRGIWLDGTTQIMDREDILLSDRLAPVRISEFPDDCCSGNMDSLASTAAVCGITLAMAGDSLIVAYFNGEIIGQIGVGAGRGSVELVPGFLDSPGRSCAADEAWGWFCTRLQEIPDSVTV